MDLRDKAAQLPLSPGVYLYKDISGRVIYVGKAKSLRLRVRSYFNDDRLADTKTGTLISEAVDVDYILVDNEKEALALENNLIKQWQPRFNILLRDDKTYPYIKLTAEKYPRVYVTRRLRKDGATYYGPYFPGNLAHRLVHFIHRHFLVPSCKVDLTRYHPKPCLQYHIHRCLGPCVEGLTTDDAYSRAVRDVRLFLEGRHADLASQLRERMEAASEATRFEEAGALRDLLSTVEELDERQKMAAAKGDDIDIFAVYAEPPLVALNVFHLRNGRRVPAGVPGHDHDLGARLPQGGGKRLAQSLIPAGDHGLAAIQRKTLQYPHPVLLADGARSIVGRGEPVAGQRRPADRDHHRRLLRVPGVADAVEHHVVALLGEQHAAARELDPEPAADQDERRRPLLPGDPLRAPVTGGMDGPLDLDVVAAARIAVRLEVPEQPAMAGRGVGGRVPHVDLLRHAPGG